MIPGRARAHEVLGLTGEDGVVPEVPAGAVDSGTFKSAARRTTVGWSVIYPDRQRAELPVVLVLHGRGADHTSAINELGMDHFLAAAVSAGVPPFALATVDGGPDNYWHKRASGDDPQRMLIEEFLPLLAKRGLRTSRFGVLGWSMGGYGALLLAADVKAPRVVAAGAMSPALWHHAKDTTPGSYDGPADFEQHRLFGRAADLEDIALRIDCGRDDPFAGATEDLRAEVRADGGLQAGLHTAGYWRRMLPDQLRFFGRKLSV
ncbi:alpha/beta hydrolase [Kribbella qitaiheensis]|uniref:alpha/beta hydrolase n=1 Tax=Kribbella qitaiheensis TaxID=1544730 RepID=UPI001FE4DC80|nr:alpha/beta hydrolase-fold protein [Kribbella qitaiheensis]